MKFRHEWKHEINYADMLTLKSRLAAVALPDKHGLQGKYIIRSLYFDNIYDKALREKLNGVNRREKFRLRYYDGSLEYIVLEKKSKINGLCNKVQTRVSVEDVKSIMAEDIGTMWKNKDPLITELGYKIQTQGLRPKTIVEYTRQAFVYDPGNVRITLDYDIRTGLTSTDFLNPKSITLPAGNSPAILEVKWDEFLPSVICDAVQLYGRHASAFSKYAACRMYG